MILLYLVQCLLFLPGAISPDSISSGDPGSSDDGCPAWFWKNSSSDECKCGSLLKGAIMCDEVNQVAFILAGFCISVDDSTNELMVAFKDCRYFGNKINISFAEIHRLYSLLPRNINKTDNAFCSYQKVEGFLCGRCVKDHGLALNSFYTDTACIDCKDNYAIVIVIVLLFLMTVFFVIVTIFQLNFASGPLLGYIIFSQIFFVSTRADIGVYDSLIASLSPFGKVALKFSVGMSGLWWYMVTVVVAFPDTCIKKGMSGLQFVSSEYILVLYPLLLVLITYVGIELHARNCRFVVYIWKPFNKCFAKVHKNVSAGNSIIHAYATFFFLSFSILTYISFGLVRTANVYNMDGKVARRVLICDPTVEIFSSGHLPYAITAVALFVLLGVVPTLILCLYPMRICTKCSQFVSARMRLNLRTFVETFQGSLRNGVNGGCDFRFLSGAPMLLFLSIAFSSVFSTIIMTSLKYVCAPAIGVILSVSFAYVKPYKSLYMNLSMSFHFGVLGLGTGVISLWYAEVEFMDTQFLASVFTMLAILPHLVALIMILVWILQRIRCLREALKKMLKGILKVFGGDIEGASESLPHRLIDSNAYT